MRKRGMSGIRAWPSCWILLRILWLRDDIILSQIKTQKGVKLFILFHRIGARALEWALECRAQLEKRTESGFPSARKK